MWYILAEQLQVKGLHLLMVDLVESIVFLLMFLYMLLLTRGIAKFARANTHLAQRMLDLAEPHIKKQDHHANGQ